MHTVLITSDTVSNFIAHLTAYNATERLNCVSSIIVSIYTYARKHARRAQARTNIVTFINLC